MNVFNVLEHAANTGFGLRSSDNHAFFVTFDGDDRCSLPSCGANAYTLAYFFKDFPNATSAMGMDQGGSTTMFVQNFGVVSKSSGGGARKIANGIFLLQE